MDKNLSIFSEKNQDILRFLEENPMRMTDEFTDEEKQIEFVRNFPYEYGSWPLVVTRSFTQQLERVGIQLMELSCKALKQYFGSDAESFSRYFGYPPMLYDIFYKHFDDVSQLVSRHDLLVCDDVVKVVEMNVGTDVGGWELDWITQSFEDRLVSQFPDFAGQLKHEHTLLRFLQDALLRAVQLKPGKADYNLVVFAKNEFVGLQESLQPQFAEMAAAMGYKARLQMTETLNAIHSCEQNITYYNGVEIDAAFMLSKTMEQEAISMRMQLTGSAVAGNLYFPDNPMFVLLSNKKLLAFLHDIKHQMPPADQEFIDTHVPLSLPMDSALLADTGSSRFLQQKDKWVIKKALSMQGLDVFLGAAMTEAEWLTLYEKYRGNGEWIIQEYVQPDPYVMASFSQGLIEHDSVWGVFYSNGSYVSSFIRALPSEKGPSVINSARKASDFFVFEETSLLHSLVL